MLLNDSLCPFEWHPQDWICVIEALCWMATDDSISDRTERVREDGRNNFRAICLSSNLRIEEVANILASEFSVTKQGEFYHLATKYTKYLSGSWRSTNRCSLTAAIPHT